jgi:hypothetical protein
MYVCGYIFQESHTHYLSTRRGKRQKNVKKGPTKRNRETSGLVGPFLYLNLSSHHLSHQYIYYSIRTRTHKCCLVSLSVVTSFSSSSLPPISLSLSLSLLLISSVGFFVSVQHLFSLAAFTLCLLSLLSASTDSFVSPSCCCCWSCYLFLVACLGGM